TRSPQAGFYAGTTKSRRVGRASSVGFSEYQSNRRSPGAEFPGATWKNRRMQAAGILLVRAGGSLLLQLRDQHAPTDANRWGIPGGWRVATWLIMVQGLPASPGAIEPEIGDSSN